METVTEQFRRIECGILEDMKKKRIQLNMDIKKLEQSLVEPPYVSNNLDWETIKKDARRDLALFAEWTREADSHYQPHYQSE